MATSNSSTASTSEPTPIMSNITPYTPCKVKNLPRIRHEFDDRYTMRLFDEETDHELFICDITFERNGEQYTRTKAFMVFNTVKIALIGEFILPGKSLVIAELYYNIVFEYDNQTCVELVQTVSDKALSLTRSSPMNGDFVSGRVYRSPYTVKQHRLVNPIITSTYAIFCLDFVNPEEFVDYFEQICQPKTTKSAAKI